MDRKEKIYEELKSYSGSGEAEGLDAQQLAELTGIDRANVSRKLNELESRLPRTIPSFQCCFLRMLRKMILGVLYCYQKILLI